MKKNILLLPAAALTAIALVSACGSEKEAKVVSRGDSSASVVQSSSSVTGKAAHKMPASAKPSETAKIGDTVAVGDWDVKVTKVQLNANDVMRHANMFNDKPKGQYVLVTYQATYKGNERTADTMVDLQWTYTTTDHQVHQTAAAVTPGDNQEWPTQARKGGTVKQQVSFDLAPAKIKGGTLSVQGYTKDFDEVYADFTV